MNSQDKAFVVVVGIVGAVAAAWIAFHYVTYVVVSREAISKGYVQESKPGELNSRWTKPGE